MEAISSSCTSISTCEGAFSLAGGRRGADEKTQTGLVLEGAVVFASQMQGRFSLLSTFASR